jgi:valyl-tRNA synthetase
MWEEKEIITIDHNQDATGKTYFAIHWFEARLKQVNSELDQLYSQFRLSEALKTLYTLIWDDFCSWYLEWVKPAYGTNHIDSLVLARTKGFFEELMKMLHPFMPFITEEIFHELSPRENGEDICIAIYGSKFISMADETIPFLAYGMLLQECITGIRDARNKAQLKPRDEAELFVQTETPEAYEFIGEILSRQVNATAMVLTNESIPQSIPAVAGKEKFFIRTAVPMDTGNQEEELKKELEYLKGFLISVEKKLENEKFVQHAKAEVVDIERKKKADAESKIRMIEESLTNLH